MRHPAHVVIFQIIPHRFIRIQLQRIRRRVEKPELALVTAYELPPFARAMVKAIVNNQEHRSRGIGNQSAEEFTKHIGVHCFLGGHKPQFPLGADRGEHVHLETGNRHGNHRCLPLRSPGRSGMIVRSNRSLVSKVDISTFLFGQFFDRRKILTHPVNDKRLILLIGPADRALWAQARFVQQSANRDVAQENTELPADQFSNYASRPQCEGKFQLSRVFANNQTIDFLQILATKLRRTTTRFAALKCIESSFTILGNSLVAARSSKPKRLDDKFGASLPPQRALRHMCGFLQVPCDVFCAH